MALELLGRLLLSGVFLLAGLSKLKDLPGSRQSLIGFGIPELLAKPLALLLPIAEAAVAVGLLVASSAWASAAAALGLLILFILVIAVSLGRGRKPDCHCFGQIHSRPIGWGLAGRDAALASVAAVIVYHGPDQPSFLSWIAASIPFPGGSVFLVILLVVVMLLILQSLAIFQLMQQSGRVLLRLDALEKQIGSSAAKEPPPPGLPIGEAAPDFELPDLEGNSVSLRQLVSGGKPVVMLFINPGCGPCTALLPEAAAWQRDAAARFNLALISQGTADENRVNAKAHGIRTFLQRGQEISSQYAVGGTPGAVLVLPDGVIGSAVASGTEAIRLLVSSVINESVLAEAAGLGGLPLREGATAPPLVFPDLEGRMFNLSQLRGKPAILLFWNPGCGFCQSMYGDLKSWEKKAVAAGTNVVLISTGTIEANRKEKFRSPVLLDQNFKAGAAFGATGTPSALALDDQGRIVSKMAVGKQDILDLVFHAAFRP